MPGPSGNFGLQAISRGFSDYRQSRLSLAYARSLGSKASLATQFNYNNLKISGYGQAIAISAELGFLLQLSSKMYTGIHLENPGNSQFGNTYLNIPAVYTIGWGYDVSEKLFLTAEIIKEEMQTVDTRIGLQYIMVPKLLLRIAIQSANASFCFGAGFKRVNWRLDLYSGYQLQLGSSMGIGLLYLFKSKKPAMPKDQGKDN